MATPQPRVSFNPLTRTLTAVWGADINTLTVRGLPPDTEFVNDDGNRSALWADPAELAILVPMIDYVIKQVEAKQLRVRDGSVERLRAFQDRAKAFLERHAEPEDKKG
ncbi:MAG: hypothetical protein NTZ05_00530 [Chloroflexi bacterium]|nr:hypothetical protein [Chloroflexota bacterium]